MENFTQISSAKSSRRPTIRAESRPLQLIATSDIGSSRAGVFSIRAIRRKMISLAGDVLTVLAIPQRFQTEDWKRIATTWSFIVSLIMC